MAEKIEVDVVRSPIELRKAHDMVTEVVTGDLPIMALRMEPAFGNLKVIRATLCWVLSHPGGGAVEELLRRLDLEALRLGYVLVHPDE